MRTPLVYDGRNIYNPRDMKAAGVEYHSIWKTVILKMKKGSIYHMRYKPLDKSKIYLVTGAAGFIGYFLCKRLLDEGCSVVGIDNLNDYYDVKLKRGSFSKS